MKPDRPSAWPSALCALVLTTTGSAPALAQYKVVAEDGSVTYTDRPRAEANARVTNLGLGGAAQTAETTLPLELRQAAQRYPVTLYTGINCPPCDKGRQWLQQRGIPYAEKRITTEEDAVAMERALGGRTVPALTIGTQPLRGLSESDWTAYLDAAGYPRVSKLPRNWQVAPATPAMPLAEKVTAGRPSPGPAPGAEAPPEPEVPAPSR